MHSTNSGQILPEDIKHSKIHISVLITSEESNASCGCDKSSQLTQLVRTMVKIKISQFQLKLQTMMAYYKKKVKVKPSKFQI